MWLEGVKTKISQSVADRTSVTLPTPHIYVLIIKGIRIQYH